MLATWLETGPHDFENEFQFQLLKNSWQELRGQRAESRTVVICITRRKSSIERSGKRGQGV
jgi:hypothetical protein